MFKCHYGCLVGCNKPSEMVCFMSSWIPITGFENILTSDRQGTVVCHKSLFNPKTLPPQITQDRMSVCCVAQHDHHLLHVRWLS